MIYNNIFVVITDKNELLFRRQLMDRGVRITKYYSYTETAI